MRPNVVVCFPSWQAKRKQLYEQKIRGIEEIYILDEHFDLLKNSRRVFRSFGCGAADT